MENVILFRNQSVDVMEQTSSKKIKVSRDKLRTLLGISVEPVVEKSTLNDSFEQEIAAFEMPTEPEPVIDRSFFGPEIKSEVKTEPKMEMPKVTPVVDAPKKEEIAKSKQYVVPDIKSSTNRGDRSEEFRRMLKNVDSTTVVGKVLVSGVNKLDRNKEKIIEIKTSIERLEQQILKLEQAKDSIATGKQDIEDLLSKTTQISLAEIREAANLDSSERANRELEKIRESIGNLQIIKEEEEAKLNELISEREKLEAERAQQKTKLMSAERNSVEICDSIERDLGTASQIERLEKEKQQLASKLSLVEEEPKKVTSVVNPFDKMRVMEEEVSNETFRRAA